jgi:hypothetical protein
LRFNDPYLNKIVNKLRFRSFVVNSIILPKAKKRNIKPRKTHFYTYNTINIPCTKSEESQVVHSVTEVNKTRGQMSQLHSKPKMDGFGGGRRERMVRQRVRRTTVHPDRGLKWNGPA